MTMTTESVEKLAYELWEKDGRPQGRDQEYYFAAERMLAGNGATTEAPKKRTARTSASTAAKPRTTSTRTKKQA